IQVIDEPQKAKLTSPQLFTTDSPLVSCIMPTANRKRFIPTAIEQFFQQDYPNKELVIYDNGLDPVEDIIPKDARIRYYYSLSMEPLGIKRNSAIENATGELIMHWDDDDWYASDWMTHQVHALLDSGADLAGINQVQFFSPTQNKYWMTKNMNSRKPWLTGASLIYRKSFWQQHPFKGLQIGEDDDFIRNNGASVFAHDYYQGFMATLHPNNTSIKFFEEAGEKSH
ncbi:MAG: glycosyltransferase family 2 protein, partial [Pedobacter sp.]|nr:glycosyltransferase family 2 protein [Pedobacter sp.]